MNRSGSEPTSAGPPGSGARRRLSLRTVLIVVVAVGVLLLIADQVTKNWAESNLPLLRPQPFLGELLQLTLLYNSGAAWGMGSGITPVVTVLQLGIVVGVLVFTVKAVRSTWYAIAMSLILGGALGNIHDRLLRPPGPFRGEVVDFLQLPNWPVFNVADMAVVGGAILVILLGVIGVPADPAVAEAEAAEKAASASEAEAAEKAASASEAEAAEKAASASEAGATQVADTDSGEQISSPATPSAGEFDGGGPDRGRDGSEPRP